MVASSGWICWQQSINKYARITCQSALGLQVINQKYSPQSDECVNWNTFSWKMQIWATLCKYGVYLIRSCREGGCFKLYDIVCKLISDDGRPSTTLYNMYNIQQAIIISCKAMRIHWKQLLLLDQVEIG